MNISSQLKSSGARNTVGGTVTRFQVDNQAMWFNSRHGQEISPLTITHTGFSIHPAS